MKRLCLGLALLPMLGGCVAAVAVPLLAGGTLTQVTKHRVHAATAVKPQKQKKRPAKKGAATEPAPVVVVTPLRELPPPSSAADDPWQKFFAYALDHRQPGGKAGTSSSAVLQPNPSLDLPQRRICEKPFPAVVIDLDDTVAPFAPEHLTSAPTGVAEGLAKLREAGVVVLWISQLPSSRAADVAQALRKAGLDPQGTDQLLLIRGKDDRKQLLRDNASDDVCIVAIAGDKQSDFDELFDYLRVPGSAVGLYPMMGNGWFLVPPIDGSPPSDK